MNVGAQPVALELALLPFVKCGLAPRGLAVSIPGCLQAWRCRAYMTQWAGDEAFDDNVDNFDESKLPRGMGDCESNRWARVRASPTRASLLLTPPGLSVHGSLLSENLPNTVIGTFFPLALGHVRPRLPGRAGARSAHCWRSFSTAFQSVTCGLELSQGWVRAYTQEEPPLVLEMRSVV